MTPIVRTYWEKRVMKFFKADCLVAKPCFRCNYCVLLLQLLLQYFFKPFFGTIVQLNYKNICFNYFQLRWAQARSHGEAFGDSAPQISFVPPQILLRPENLF